jgi:general secretion pathway protein F
MEADAASFRRFAIGMVRAGEAAGALEIVVSRLADFMERANQLKDGVVSALIYPTLLMLAALATVILLLTVVLPRFQPLFEQAGKQLPLPTRVVLAAGDLMQASRWLAPLLVLAVVMVLVRRAGDPDLRLVLDRLALRLPVLGRVLAELEVARLLRGLSTLLTNGVPVLAALAILRETAGNEAVSRWVDAAADSLKRGRGLSEPTRAQPWFPPVAARLLAVGEETGRLDDMVGRAADMLDANAGRTLQRGLALLGPALTLVLGLVVAGVIAAILLAILKVNDLAM